MNRIMMMFAAAALSIAALTGCSSREAEIEKHSQALVEQICKQKNKNAKCTKVKITKKIDGEHYEGVATVKIKNEAARDAKTNNEDVRDVKIKIELKDKQIIVILDE